MFKCYVSIIFLIVSVLLVLLNACTAGEKPDGETDKKTVNITESNTETTSDNESIIFLSTQLNPAPEANKMRKFILKDFEGSVIFQPSDDGLINKMLDLEMETNPHRSFLVGGLHGDLLNFKTEDSLKPLDDFLESLTGRKFIPDFVDLAKFNTKFLYYIPWMQATYLMAANKKALKYLPKGADTDDLTYSELILWGKNMYEATGVRKIGFPLGEKGLMYRFFQGYLYPSYTGSILKKFRSPEAVFMWTEFKELWKYVNPASMVHSNMSQPLLTDDIWVTWDHSARLIKALETEPDEFIVFPAPAGPSGRGYIVVLSGLSIPRDSTVTKGAYNLIEYLTRPEIQIVTLNNTGFFPVVDFPEEKIESKALKQFGKAISLQSKLPGGIPTLLPMGLGELGSEFNSIYLLAFSSIILENKNISSTLDNFSVRLQNIMDKAGADCWPPDISTESPCLLE